MPQPMNGRAGIDVGSTTAKLVVTSAEGEVRFAGYRRHNADVVATMERFGLPARFEMIAGLVKSAAALGLVAGLFASSHHGRGFPTTLVAWCLVAYFAVAAIFHVRAHDAAKETAPAIGLLLVSLALAVTASVG